MKDQIVFEYWKATRTYWVEDTGLDNEAIMVAHAKNQWCAHLRSPNGEIILASEGYNDEAGAKHLHSVLTANGLRATLKKVKAPKK